MMERGSGRLGAVEVGDALDHFVTGYDWSIPTDFHIEDVVLYWRAEPGPFPRVRPGPGILEDFLKLVRRPDQAILEYARHWGPLWLDEGGRPWRKDPDGQPNYWVVHDAEGELVTEYYEGTEDWRAIAAEAAATIRVSRQLHAGRLALATDWQVLRFFEDVLFETLLPGSNWPNWRAEELDESWTEDSEQAALYQRLWPDDEDVEEAYQAYVARPRSRPLSQKDKDDMHEYLLEEEFERRVHDHGRERLRTELEFQRTMLSQVLNYWLDLGGVKPRLDWHEDKPEVQLGGYGLIGALAVQLLFDCSRTDGLVVCTSCGTPFLPAFRRPRRDRNPYCTDCGPKAVARDAAARYRQTAKYRATYEKWLRGHRRH